MVKKLREDKTFKLPVNLSNGAKTVEIDIEDLVVTETPRSGWSVASHAGESVALEGISGLLQLNYSGFKGLCRGREPGIFIR